MMYKTIQPVLRTILFIVLLIFFCGGIYKNLHIYNHFPQDLRNRVVGARMVHDGVSPYFYTWRQGEHPAYFDINLFENYGISHVTATPFFLQLFYPLAKAEQPVINKWWFIISNLLYVLSVFLALLLCRKKEQYLLVFFTAALLLYSEAWQYHLFRGQYYIVFPFLGLLFFYLSSRDNNKIIFAFLAGITAAVLLLFKPTTLLFILPVIVVGVKSPLKRKKNSWLIIAMILVLAVQFFTGKQRGLWADYFKAVKLHTAMQREDKLILPAHAPMYPAEIIEGYPKNFYSRQDQDEASIHRELSSLYFLTRSILGINLPAQVLFIIFCIIVVAVLLPFFIYERTVSVYIILAGYILFTLADFFSQVQRYQYYTVLWLFPALVMAGATELKQRKILFLLYTGLLLQIISPAFIKMEHTIGEFILFAAALLFCYTGIKKNIKQKPV